MTTPSNTYKQFDIIVVPFPFAESTEVKRRPAVVLSKSAGFHKASHCIVAAMITSAKHSAWPQDVAIRNPSSVGLRTPCVVRMKLFTLDTRMIIQTIGRLGAAEQKQIKKQLKDLF